MDNNTVLTDLLTCCRAWDEDVRILGNIRAGDAAAAIEKAIAKLGQPAASEAGAVPVAWRALDGHGLPQTDWIDGDPGEDMQSAWVGGRIERAYTAPAAESAEPKEIHGLGGMTDDDDGFVTLRFVDEAAATKFMREYACAVDIREMPAPTAAAAGEQPKSYPNMNMEAEPRTAEEYNLSRAVLPASRERIRAALPNAKPEVGE